VKEYAAIENSNVAFGDVNLQKAPGTGSAWSPGAGGWPTVRYFNAETGYNGAPYVQKTSKSMCDELGDQSYMRQYVEDKSVKPCAIHGAGDNGADPLNCSEQERDFISTWIDKSVGDIITEHTRLQRIVEAPGGAKLNPTQKQWIKQRFAILKQVRTKREKDL